MERIHFPRYHSKENFTTSNVLSFLSYLYAADPNVFYSFLMELLGIDESFGVVATMQEPSKDGKSVLDALVCQRGFAIAVETKLKGDFTFGQLKNHLSLFEKDEYKNVEYKMLLTLDSSSEFDSGIQENLDVELNKYAAQGIRVQHYHRSFSDLVRSARNCYSSVGESASVIDDFEQYCFDEKLITELPNCVLVPVKGNAREASIDKRVRVYCRQLHRPLKDYIRYIALYADKRVYAIGKIEKIARSHEDGSLEIERNLEDEPSRKDELTAEDQKRINEYIQRENISEPHRFFLVDVFAETDFTKDSPGGLQGFKYIRLEEYLGEELAGDASTQDIADALRKKEWE